MVVRGRGVLVVAACALAALVGCASSGDNAAPVIAPIPGQVTAGGGTMFSLDLAPFVSDRDGNPLSFSVTSGGGSFAGSVYSNMFATLGTYTVEFSVTDGMQVRSGSFDVQVTTANLAVVAAGDDLQLLDTDTRSFLTVSGATGFADTFVAALDTGEVVYRRTVSTERLFVYDPNTRQTHVLGDSATHDAAYLGKTADGDVVFTRTPTADPGDSDLFLWRRETGMIKEISAVAGEPDGNAMVASNGLVYFQRGVPSDVWHYDPATDQATAVATAATAEVLLGTLPGGAVVLSRIGAGGETDLWHHELTTGLVEIGADLSTTVQAQSKTFGGATSDGKVAFEAAGAGADLYVWSPASGTTRAIATSGVDETFAAVTALDEIVYVVATTPTDDDLFVYSYATDSSQSISPADSVNDVYQADTGIGDVVFLRETGTGDDLWFWDASAATAYGVATAASDDYSFDAVLENDRLVYTQAGGSGGVFVVTLTSTPSPTTVAGAGSTFAGATSGGDFVVQTTVSAQTDLVLWDESATSTVTVSNTAGDDTFGAGTAAGEVLFGREVAGKTTSDLFLWDPTNGETRLTDATVDHAVVATYSADNG